MHLLFVILVLLVITRVFAELAERLTLPALIGEILAGILVGAVITLYPEQFPISFLEHGIKQSAFEALTELGMFFMMLLAGLEMEPLEIAGASRRAFLVALGGMAVPFASGMAVGYWLLPPSPYVLVQSLFLGTALSITAVPVTVRVLMDLGHLHSSVGRTVVSAAIFDDLLSLFILAILTGMIHSGAMPTPGAMIWLAGKALLYFAITLPVGWYLFPMAGRRMRYIHVVEADFTGLLVAALAFALLADALGLHFIVGSFTAGVFFYRRVVDLDVYERVNQQVSAITSGFLAPIFFASIGLHLSLSGVVDAPLIAGGIFLLALASKLLGAGGAAWLTGMGLLPAAMVGIAMSGRGAVELIVAEVALEAGLFDHPSPDNAVVSVLYPAVVLMAVGTTLLTPLSLRWFLKRNGHRLKEAPPAAPDVLPYI